MYLDTFVSKCKFIWRDQRWDKIFIMQCSSYACETITLSKSLSKFAFIKLQAKLVKCIVGLSLNIEQLYV